MKALWSQQVTFASLPHWRLSSQKEGGYSISMTGRGIDRRRGPISQHILNPALLAAFNPWHPDQPVDVLTLQRACMSREWDFPSPELWSHLAEKMDPLHPPRWGNGLLWLCGFPILAPLHSPSWGDGMISLITQLTLTACFITIRTIHYTFCSPQSSAQFNTPVFPTTQFLNLKDAMNLYLKLKINFVFAASWTTIVYEGSPGGLLKTWKTSNICKLPLC